MKGLVMYLEKEKKDFFDSGHLNDELTARYADALLTQTIADAGLPVEALRHVEECMDCKDRILDISMFLRNPDAGEESARPRAIITGTPMRTFEMETPRPWFRFPMRIAALFFVAALMVGVYFFAVKEGGIGKDARLNPTETENVQPIKTKGTHSDEGKTSPVNGTVETTGKQAVPGKTVLPPINFRVNPNLESMIGTRYRSASIQVFSPADNLTTYAGSDIVFSWKLAAQGTVTLKIIDNMDEETYEYEVTGGRFVLKEHLPPGLYYWKLEDHQDLLFIGKFFVRKRKD
jgi:hypothetical protein